jgi:signal transduction histidine kinase
MSLLSKGNRKALDLVRNLIESFRSRKDTGLLHFEIVDLASLITNTVQEIEATAEPNDAKITVTIVENLPACIYDKLAISRVISNLLDNAVKFSPNGGAVQISAERVSDQILLKVSDNGIGIHDEDKETVFRKCKRNQKQRYTPGCGLGLYICKEIVKAHNGTISLESAIGMGTTMSVLLPIVAGKSVDSKNSTGKPCQ